MACFNANFCDTVSSTDSRQAISELVIFANIKVLKSTLFFLKEKNIDKKSSTLIIKSIVVLPLLTFVLTPKIVIEKVKPAP